jgi:heme/copper-type cytochrome/quinol oxidase subunit 3
LDLLFFKIDFELTSGNYDVLLANIGILTASSFFVTIGHIRKSLMNFILTTILGILFLINQIDELFSVLSLSGAEEFSLVLFCLFTHLSHLILSLLFFIKFILRNSDIFDDNTALFVAAY